MVAGNATLGELTEFLAYVATLYEPIRWFSRVPRMFSNTFISMTKVAEVLDEKDDMTDGTEVCDLKGEVEFKDDDVYLQYFEGDGSIVEFMTDKNVWGEDLTAYPGFADAVIENVRKIKEGICLI